MKDFEIKETKGNVLNTFRMEIEIGHGDDDYREIIQLGPYQQDELFMIAGIEKAFQEMEQLDQETNNKMNYDELLHFRRYLKKHWKEDREAAKSGFFQYVYMKSCRVFHIDKKGIEHEIHHIKCNKTPLHYYICIHNQTKHPFFTEEDVIITNQLFEEEIEKAWGLHLLDEGEDFLTTFRYHEETYINLLEQDEEFLITRYYVKSRMETDEEVEKFHEELERLKASKKS